MPGDAVKDGVEGNRRGVWRALCDRDGVPLIAAIDSKGRCVATVALHRGLDAIRLKRTLSEILDAVDPPDEIAPHVLDDSRADPPSTSAVASGSAPSVLDIASFRTRR